MVDKYTINGITWVLETSDDIIYTAKCNATGETFIFKNEDGLTPFDIFKQKLHDKYPNASKSGDIVLKSSVVQPDVTDVDHVATLNKVKASVKDMKSATSRGSLEAAVTSALQHIGEFGVSVGNTEASLFSGIAFITEPDKWQIDKIRTRTGFLVDKLNYRIGEFSREILADGLESGKSLYDVLKENNALYDDTDGIRRITDVYARSIMMESARDASLHRYISLGYSSFQWLAADDERTCSICRDYFHKSLTEGYTINTIPEYPHPGCRCTLVPKIDDTSEPERFRHLSSIRNRFLDYDSDIKYGEKYIYKNIKILGTDIMIDSESKTPFRCPSNTLVACADNWISKNLWINHDDDTIRDCSYEVVGSVYNVRYDDSVDGLLADVELHNLTDLSRKATYAIMNKSMNGLSVEINTTEHFSVDEDIYIIDHVVFTGIALVANPACTDCIIEIGDNDVTIK